MMIDASTRLVESVGQRVVRTLEAHGVDHVFGIPGTHNLELYRGLAGARMRHVVFRHEQGAGYAADGYARSTGRPGVVVTTSGPGILNALTALATSYADSIPVLAISPGPPTGTERAERGWLHAVKDQRAALDSVVDRSVRCSSAEEAIDEICRTFRAWRLGRPLPVHVEVPVDVLESCVQAEPVTPYRDFPQPDRDMHAISGAARLLTAAQRPLVVAGGGAVGATAELIDIASRIGAPVVTTVGGKAAIPESNPLSGGVALPYAMSELTFADVVLVVGSELARVDTEDRFPRGARVVRVDISEPQLGKPQTPVSALLGDSARVVRDLVGALGDYQADLGAAVARAAAIRSAVAGSVPQTWRRLHEVLADTVGDDAIVCGDSSQVSYRGTAPAFPQQSPRKFLYPNGFGTLGYAIPAAVGAQLGNPSTPVVAVLGDGALMFSVQEMMTAVEASTPIVAVVVDNGGYREIRDQMRDRQIPFLAVDLVRPAYGELARAFGWTVTRVTDVEELGIAVRAGLDRGRPHLCVVGQDVLDDAK